MQCNCGGVTKEHDVVRDKAIVGSYQECIACGRVWKDKKLIDFLVGKPDLTEDEEDCLLLYSAGFGIEDIGASGSKKFNRIAGSVKEKTGVDISDMVYRHVVKH